MLHRDPRSASEATRALPKSQAGWRKRSSVWLTLRLGLTSFPGPRRGWKSWTSEWNLRSVSCSSNATVRDFHPVTSSSWEN